jgi:hypothetical protein
MEPPGTFEAGAISRVVLGKDMSGLSAPADRATTRRPPPLGLRETRLELPPDAQIRVVWFDQGPLEVSRDGPLFFRLVNYQYIYIYSRLC